MDAPDAATFFGLVLLGATCGLLAVVFTPKARVSIAGSGLVLAAMVAVGASLGSLYMSEVANFVPCELCWFQRVAMYPMAILLPMAAVRGGRHMLRYALVLSGVGLAISTYHVQLQLFPDQSSFCDAINPCSGRWVEAFGWMTIPQMAWLSFALIAVIAAVSLSSDKTQELQR
jgi:disulfide bond formation protein DsbB